MSNSSRSNFLQQVLQEEEEENLRIFYARTTTLTYFWQVVGDNEGSADKFFFFLFKPSVLGQSSEAAELDMLHSTRMVSVGEVHDPLNVSFSLCRRCRSQPCTERNTTISFMTLIITSLI